MNLLQRYLIGRRARRDALAGIYQPEERIVAVLGRRPKFDAIGNVRHARMQQEMNMFPEMNELQGDVYNLQTQATRNTAPRVVLLLLLAFFAIETAAATGLMAELNIDTPERLLWGAMLAVLLVYLTYEAVRLHRSKWLYVVGPGLGILFVAMATARLEFFSDDGDDLASNWPAAIIMLGVTIGIPFAFEHFLKQYAEAIQIPKRMRVIRRRFRQMARKQRDAQRGVDHFERRGERWDDAAAQATAIYKVHHAFTRNSQATNSEPSEEDTDHVRN